MEDLDGALESLEPEDVCLKSASAKKNMLTSIGPPTDEMVIGDR